MTKNMKQGLIKIAIDFFLDKDIYKTKNLVIKVYQNKKSSKIPICFQSDETPLNHLVIDYDSLSILDTCDGINDYDEFIRLNCDLVILSEIGYINYYLDQELTDILNEKLVP